jgi:hypothetical protein
VLPLRAPLTSVKAPALHISGIKTSAAVTAAAKPQHAVAQQRSVLAQTRMQEIICKRLGSISFACRFSIWVTRR